MGIAAWPGFGGAGLLTGAGAALALAAPLSARPAPARAQVALPSPGGGASGSAYELTFWQSVAASDDPAQLDAYLASYPNGAFSRLARLKIAALRQRQAPAEAAPAPASTPVAVAAPVVPAQMTVSVVPPPAPTPAVAPAPTPADPPMAHPPAGPAVTASPAAPADVQAPSLADQLRLLASGQGAGPVAPGAATVQAVGLAVPPAPELAKLPEVRLPGSFCSAEARNLFYDSDYKPAMELADRNNQAAIAHLQELQALYDQRGRRGDITGQNQMAAAARDYGPVAAEAFRARSEYDATFNRLMAVPVRPCVAGGN